MKNSNNQFPLWAPNYQSYLTHNFTLMPSMQKFSNNKALSTHQNQMLEEFNESTAAKEKNRTSVNFLDENINF